MNTKKDFGLLEKLAPIYVVNGTHVVFAKDAQKCVEDLSFKLQMYTEKCKNYEHLLDSKLPVPNNVITLRSVK